MGILTGDMGHGVDQFEVTGFERSPHAGQGIARRFAQWCFWSRLRVYVDSLAPNSHSLFAPNGRSLAWTAGVLFSSIHRLCNVSWEPRLIDLDAAVKT